MRERLGEIAAQLDELTEEIGELALDDLRANIRSGGHRATAAERQLTQARRALDKAAGLLRAAAAGNTSAQDATDDM